MGKLYHTPWPQGPGIIAEEGGETVRGKGIECQQQSRIYGTWQGRWTHDLTACLHAQDLCPRSRLPKSQHKLGKSSRTPTPSWGAIGNLWLLGGKSPFYLGMQPLETNCAQADGFTPVHRQGALSRISGFVSFLREHGVGKEEWWRL